MESKNAYETGGSVKAVKTPEHPAIAKAVEAEEAEAIARCVGGDVSGYRWLYGRYGQPLLRTALRILERREEAEDVP
jgi:hypothetical protein